MPTPQDAVHGDHGPHGDQPGGNMHATPVSQGSSIMSYPTQGTPPKDGGGLSHIRSLKKY